MKFECYCGRMLHDHTDAMAHKAWLIPDQAWLQMLDAIEQQVIQPLLKNRLLRPSEDQACQQLRQIIHQPARSMYQCSACGRLYINDPAGELHCYEPRETGTSRRITPAD